MLLDLLNGTDVRGVAAEGVPGENITLTPDIANRIAQGFVTWLSDKTGRNPDELTIGVGHDSRITADLLKEAILAGLMAKDVKVVDCGLASTPAMFMSTVMDATKLDAAVMITASHLPFNRNGMKFFTNEGGMGHEEMTEILKIAEPYDVANYPYHDYIEEHDVKKCDLLNIYSRHLSEKIKSELKDIANDSEKPLAGLHIVVDAGNGAGGFYVNDVLIPLGADTEGSQFLEPDGRFPNHIPNPENKVAMDAIKNAVLKSHADLGIIFDTDVDRMSAVLHDGREVNRDAIIAMMSAILAPAYPGSTIVTDSVTSDRLAKFLSDLGLKQHRFKRGYKNVIDECRRLNESGVVSPLAMETSGHGALKENYYLDDGAFLAVKLIIALARMKKEGKDLASLIEALPPAVEEDEIRLRITKEDFRSVGPVVLEHFKKKAEERKYILPESHEGVRISFRGDPAGWMLIRASLHDPQIVINYEGEHEGDILKMREITRDMLCGEEDIEFGKL